MTTLAAQIPDDLARLAHEAAAKEKVSVDQIVARALAAQFAARRSGDTVAMRTARGTPDGLRAFLAKAPDVPPIPGDELPPGHGDA